MKKLAYNPDFLQSFDKEWLIHKNCKEWWYATGVLFDEENNMYSYQYTLLYFNFKIVTVRIGMIALTDYKNKRHYYKQIPALTSKNVVISENEATFKGIASAVKTHEGIDIEVTHKDFTIKVKADYGKGPFWHCDHGKLQMGVPGKKETTFYYSYTNMPSVAELTINGEKKRLTGKTWFDKQGGTYSVMKAFTHWEWFSLRFFDNEEIMLFTFPQNEYYDGTYINEECVATRLNDYKITCLEETEAINMKWSCKWKVECNIKDKVYYLEPVQKGHINFAYFEELCYIKDENHNLVGYAFAELLPGVKNDLKSMGTTANLFKKIEY